MSEIVVLDNGEVLRTEDAEIIEIHAARPENTAFDRGVELRLTGVELRKRGATNLAEALALIPELYTRDLGRGGSQITIRGARRNAVAVVIDGIPMNDVYYNTFDVSSIPITEIARIHVSTAPATPLDGIGGLSGVIEVFTINAFGRAQVRARANVASPASAEFAVTGRARIARTLAVRGSLTAITGMRTFEITDAEDDPDNVDAVDEDRQQFTGSVRADFRRGDLNLRADLLAQHQRYLVPPRTDGGGSFLRVKGENTARLGLRSTLAWNRLMLEGRAHAQFLSRLSQYYADPQLREPLADEDLVGGRLGLNVAARGSVRDVRLIGSAQLAIEAASAENSGVATTGYTPNAGVAGGFELDRGPLSAQGALGMGTYSTRQSPWLEGKIALSLALAPPLTIALVLARKGALPALRDRFRSDVGNPDLRPELANVAEFSVRMTPSPRIRFVLAGYVRDSLGMIRFDPTIGKLANIDRLLIHGFDARLTVELPAHMRIGASCNYAAATSRTLGADPLNFFPTLRADAWLGVDEWRLGPIPMSARARVRHVGEQKEQNGTSVPYAVADLSAQVRVSERLDGVFRIDNLLDERYPLRTGVTAIGRMVSVSVQGSLD